MTATSPAARDRAAAAEHAMVDYAIAMSTSLLYATLLIPDNEISDTDLAAKYETAIAAYLAAHPWTIAADHGADTETDYYAPQDRAQRRFRIWDPEHQTVIFDTTTDHGTIEQFMADHGLTEAHVVVDYCADEHGRYHGRWSGLVQLGIGDRNTLWHNDSEYLNHLTVWNNPFLEAIGGSDV